MVLPVARHQMGNGLHLSFMTIACKVMWHLLCQATTYRKDDGRKDDGSTSRLEVLTGLSIG